MDWIIQQFWPYMLPAIMGWLLAWFIVHTVKTIRRDMGVKRWPSSAHRMLAVVMAFAGTLSGTVLFSHPTSVSLHLAIFAGIACPMVGGLFLRMTKGGDDGSVRNWLHWQLRGNRRNYQGHRVVKGDTLTKDFGDRRVAFDVDQYLANFTDTQRWRLKKKFEKLDESEDTWR